MSENFKIVVHGMRKLHETQISVSMKLCWDTAERTRPPTVCGCFAPRWQSGVAATLSGGGNRKCLLSGSSREKFASP